jgi:putative membrane protein
MRSLGILAWLLGAAGLVWLFATNDFAALLGAAASLRGWLAPIILFHLVVLFCDVLGWRLLFARRPRLGELFRIRWIGEAANGLLPLSHLGELLRVKLARDRGSDTIDAAASVIADVTLGLATQILFVAVGLVLFGLREGASALVRAVAAALVLALFGFLFYALQRTRLLSRLVDAIGRRTGSRWHLFDGAGARRLEDALHALYNDRRRVAGGLFWRQAAWFLGAGEIWLIPACLGHPIGMGEAITLESLSQAARAAAFIVPGGLGVQDGTLMVLSTQLGLGPELGLLVSLVKRLREVTLGLPALGLAMATSAFTPVSAESRPARSG